MSDFDTGCESSREFQKSLLEAILEASPDGILVVNKSRVVISHNRRFCSLFDIEPDESGAPGRAGFVGSDESPLLSQALERIKDPEHFLQRVVEIYENPDIRDLDEVELINGRVLERHSLSLWDSNQNYLGRVWFFRDITERKGYELGLEELSFKDPLTGVSNRRHFLERAAEEISRSRRIEAPLSLVYLDIDGFKAINDHHGHSIGDEIMKSLTRLYNDVSRKQDLFARVGGEEFSILLPDTSLDGALECAERFRKHVECESIEVNGIKIQFTFSAGVATLCKDDSSIESVVSRADAAMYRAKKEGRNRVLREGSPVILNHG